MSHILVLHEDPGYGRSICRLLKRNDMRASVARHDDQALNCIRALWNSPEKIDVIITDDPKIQSREISLVSSLKEEDINIPFIVIAGCTETHLRSSGSSDRVVYINEPIEEKTLIHQLERILA